MISSGWVSAGSGDPGPTSHFMVFRPSSNALWGTVLTVPKVCKDPTSQNQITSPIPYPTSQRIPIWGTTTKTAFGKCRRLFLNNSKLYHFTLISSASCGWWTGKRQRRPVRQPERWPDLQQSCCCCWKRRSAGWSCWSYQRGCWTW